MGALVGAMWGAERLVTEGLFQKPRIFVHGCWKKAGLTHEKKENMVLPFP